LALGSEQQRLKNCYLFIDTDFKRKSEPIFVLAFMEHKRRITHEYIGDLYFKSDDEILTIVSEFVIEDHFTRDGMVAVWGRIVSYNWHHVDGRVYVFDKNGCYKCTNENIIESQATLKIKGK